MTRYDLIREWCVLRSLCRESRHVLRRLQLDPIDVKRIRVVMRTQTSRRRSIERELGFRPNLAQFIAGGYDPRPDTPEGEE